ncbi:PEP/pyruvate-binding domain-containing protein [Longimicrobium sp.]|uniref:PEP/pyruvate-binding domain-containing protein n=1 Tax=Longimicrobium sp. TaxID=2029185 RepID=UPI002E32654A|nr:PEP/pyruvate-binding domain-containing protein [Longimicrobium sp.]HEX6042628.1 PEP/pyruvate-binding domain-containing protein [Longimicrobium sp.]
MSSAWAIHAGGAVPPLEAVGGKARNLALLGEAGADVPPWIAIGTAAFERLVGDAPSSLTADAEAARTNVARMELPADFRAEVLHALDAAGLRGALLAVRSSAVGEDGASASFAGQFETVLGVRADGDAGGLWDAIRHVWASAFSAHAAAYRARQGGVPARMAVIIQQMVDAQAAGVAFSADPVRADGDTAVVSAVFGLGEGLVSGELDADTYHVSSTGGVTAEIATKDRALGLQPDGGSAWIPVHPNDRLQPALTEDEARRIASAARSLAAHFGAPQDVEWALANDATGGPRRLFILQTRPITTRVKSAATAPNRTGGERRLWDNSNIVESYSGVTTPLTFSFARSVYEQVYLQFCRLLGVSEELLTEHRHVFANMLGLVNGRVYYNLLNWYRVLALLPGYTVNREFMERMMGVREKLEDAPAVPVVAGKWEDTGRTVRMVGKLITAQRGLKREVPAFHARVDAALAPLAGVDLSAKSADALAALYRDLEEKLLRHWRAPLVNDFFAMIFFGVLVKLVEKWIPGAPPTLANDLLVGEGGIISTEPAKRVLELSARVAADPTLTALFETESDDARLWTRIGQAGDHADFHGELRAYLDRFGDRCANELKLETLTHGDDPSFLVRLIRTYARAGAVRPQDGAHEAQVRASAEATVRSRLRGLRRRAFFSVLRQARTRIRDRENLRFERTRVFGAVRRIFLGIGARLAESGRLDASRDVLYLRVDEIFAHLDGTGVTTDLRALAALRKAEFAAYERAPAPPDRFETHGPPTEFVAALAPAAAPSAELRGTGASPGVVRAPVRVVRDPNHAGELTGHILVAERTDPGWTLLFPAVEGILVQRGSLLSHSAIVARELALPCVVGIAGLLDTLRDGEMVEMDGTAGTIRRLDAPDAEPSFLPPRSGEASS